MTGSPLAAYHDNLERLEAQGRLRALRPAAGIDFSSNDYLALAGAPRLAEAARRAILRGVPLGSGGSRLLRGNHLEHEALEEEAAVWFGAEAALFFATGYSANVAAFGSLPQRGDLVVYDALVHASAHDGMRLGRAEAAQAPHNDAGAFQDAILAWRKRGGKGRPWIAVESLYSMEGDAAPLAELAAIAGEHGGFLLIDEAHATGVFGTRGEGLAGALHRADNIVTLHTCGKALGCEGALLCLPRVLRDFLINRARPFIFSTAPSPVVAAAVREAIRALGDEPERRDKLWALVRHADVAFGSVGIRPTGSQILPFVIGEDEAAMSMAAELRSRGFDVRGIRPPTVPAGSARLRISLTLSATPADVDALAGAIGALKP